MFNFQICAYLRWLLSSRLQLEEQTVLPQTKLSLLLWLRIFMCWKLGYYILGSAQQKSTLLELILNSEHHPPVSWFYDFLVNKMVLFPWEGDMLRNFDLRKGHIVLKNHCFYRTQVRSLVMLFTHFLTDSLTDSLTHSCLVDLVAVNDTNCLMMPQHSTATESCEKLS